MLRRVSLLLGLGLALVSVACGDDETTGAGGSGGSGGGGATTTTTTGTTTSTTTGGGGGTTTGDGGGGQGGEGGQGGGIPIARGSFELSWTLTIADEEADCFALGAEYVDVGARPAGSDGPITTTRLTCGDLEGETDELFLGAYDITVALLDFEEQPVVPPLELTGELVEDGAVVTLDPVTWAVEGARFDIGWIITDGGEDSTCEAAGANTADIILMNTETFITYGAAFPCSDGTGTSRALPLGTYGVSPALLDFDVVLYSAEVFEAELTEANAVERMPQIVFDITANQ